MRLVSIGFRELTQFVGGSVEASAEFNKAFTESTAIMGDLSDTLKDEMIVAAEEVARATTFSAKEAAEAYFFLASAGLDANESIGALPQVASFAQAGAFDLARATDLLTDAQSALGLSSDDSAENMRNMARVSDVLVKANTSANASVEQFATSLTQKGATALKTVNKSLEEGVAVLSVWADSGIKGEQAGTALNRVILDLTSKATQNAKAFKANNIAVFDSTGTMRNMADIVQDLEERLDGMSDAQKKATFQQLGFADKSSVYISSLVGQSQAIRDYQEGLENATGFTRDVAAKQLESYSSKVKLHSDEWELLQTTLGDFVTENEAVLTAIQSSIDLMQRLNISLTDNREAWIKGVGEGIDLALGAVDAFLTSAGLLITGLGKVAQFLLFVYENTTILTKAQIEALKPLKEMAEGIVDFGEKALRAGAEIDILQEKIKFASEQQLKAIAGTDKHTEALLDTQRAR
jgi:TP901 family phage tail tape measure protein